jgi:hypothetical protein
MLSTPQYNQELLDAPLWHVEMPGTRACVAERGDRTFLVLFTSPARAHDFVQRTELHQAETFAPRLYSATREEFYSRAQSSAAGGLNGVVVDPQVDGNIGGLIEFRVDSEKRPA